MKFCFMKTNGVNFSYKVDQKLIVFLLIVEFEMTTNNNNNPFRAVLEKDKLNGTNFLDWYRNLQIVLRKEKRLYVLENPIPDEPARTSRRDVQDAYPKHLDDSGTVTNLMLLAMETFLQKDHENMAAYDIMMSLKQMFQQQARQERYDTTKSLLTCKMAEGADVSQHVIKMKGYIDQLSRLGFPMGNEFATDLILHSLPRSYD